MNEKNVIKEVNTYFEHECSLGSLPFDFNIQFKYTKNSKVQYHQSTTKKYERRHLVVVLAARIASFELAWQHVTRVEINYYFVRLDS